ncbi:hypothetical protein T11_7801 [Trichinella zimbabwensis]|uniref:Uncharacterized protein n=1 Tax=Trichinella zimbabwensis TaxID=268475 RepID=A0A0V1DL09_9BILA|nr:hypothetical protein T11_5635 [Trichinella zimbabwensis]KRY62495.1 hypothetical protein T11_11265 [Trichinella zimbabwensis]KRY86871.1 hypothetical protein T11_7801 [Trichinella zimbabwensis]
MHHNQLSKLSAGARNVYQANALPANDNAAMPR